MKVVLRIQCKDYWEVDRVLDKLEEQYLFVDYSQAWTNIIVVEEGINYKRYKIKMCSGPCETCTCSVCERRTKHFFTAKDYLQDRHTMEFRPQIIYPEDLMF